MKIHYCCPSCSATTAAEFDSATEQLECMFCESPISVPSDAFQGGELTRCLVCPSEELFVRKDFPQRLGLTIIVVGFIAASIAWYFYLVYLTFGVLLATAMIDAALYIWMGDVVACYRCHAEYRGLNKSVYSPFDLEIHEKYRQQASRLEQAAAGAPTSESVDSQVRY